MGNVHMAQTLVKGAGEGGDVKHAEVPQEELKQRQSSELTLQHFWFYLYKGDLRSLVGQPEKILWRVTGELTPKHLQMTKKFRLCTDELR